MSDWWWRRRLRVSVLVPMMPRKKVDSYGEKDGKGIPRNGERSIVCGASNASCEKLGEQQKTLLFVIVVFVGGVAVAHRTRPPSSSLSFSTTTCGHYYYNDRH